MQSILNVRQELSKKVAQKLVSHSFTIISDDCWGGVFYRYLNLPYLTPTVGLWIKPADYIKYIENFDHGHQEPLIFQTTAKDYPVATLSGAEINFMHYKSQAEAQQKYTRRLLRVQNNRQFFKIDFGKPGYTIDDIRRWNKLKLKNSVAFYPSTMELPEEVHNGIAVSDWSPNGALMFDITRKYFDLFQWIQSGRLEKSLLYTVFNALLFDPTAPKRIFTNLLYGQPAATRLNLTPAPARAES